MCIDIHILTNMYCVYDMCIHTHACTHTVASGYVIELKFMCPKHSEAKQTKTLEFGSEKGLLKDQAKQTGGSCSKYLKSLMIFREDSFLEFFFFFFFFFVFGIFEFYFIYFFIQQVLISQSNLEKQKWSWRNQTP